MDLAFVAPTEVNKKIFKLKPLRTDGLLLKVHHTTDSSKVRFVHGCFHHSSNIVAVANNQGTIFIIDYSVCKFWGLPKINSCSVIEFSQHSDNHLLIGAGSGDILISDIDTGTVQNILHGHKSLVENLTFSKKHYCLSASKNEALIWDLRTSTKIQVMNLELGCSLKYVSFIPFSGNILACFQDDLIQVWSRDNFKTIKQYSPSNWKNYLVKSITFTRNGEFMTIAGHVPYLSIFHLHSSKLLKIINLSDFLISVKHIEFVSQVFDGGCNKILAILSGHGVIYFFDVEQNDIISELRCGMEINKFVCSPEGSHILFSLCSGEAEVFDIKQYVLPPEVVRVHKVRKKWKVNRKRCLNNVKFIKEEIENMLDMKKLKFILKEHLEYPEAFRMKIWERLLKLPNNVYKYNSVINHVTIMAFDDLYEKYPLEDKIFVKGLKRLLNNLVTWCPFFAFVEYLPVFAFPFVKVFHNKPLTCFECVCTVLWNWCQHWFEYFPLAPVNILAIIENLLLEHDPELLHHFVTHNVTSHVYAWSLLETAFSEVLTSREWLMLWDHILTNELSFLLAAVVAYNVVQKQLIMAMDNIEEIEMFFKNQNPIGIKKFIKITYHIMNSTSQKFHPRQYLNVFSALENGKYPVFINFPQKMIEFQEAEMDKLDKDMINLLANEQNLAGVDQKSIKDVVKIDIMDEEKRRLKEVEKLCAKQIKAKQDLVIKEKERLHGLQHYASKSDSQDSALMTEFLRKSCDKRSSQEEIMESRQRKKLNMAMNVDLLNRFIKKLDIDLKTDGEHDGQICQFELETKVSHRKVVKNPTNIDLLNKFVKNLDTDYQSKSVAVDIRCLCETETATEEEKHNKLREDLASEKIAQRSKNSSSGLQKECKYHGTEDCYCENFCPKSVRFTSSTTGGSAD